MEFYRLGSAARKLHLSEDELWDIAEQGKLTFSVYIPEQSGTICNQEMVGLGVGTLSGYTTIPKWALNSLYKRKSVWVEQIALEESHQIVIKSRDNPFKTELPNKYLKGWLSNPDSAPQSNSGFFWIGLQESNNGGDFFSAFQFMLNQPQTIQESEGRLKLFEKKLIECRQLEISHFEISIDDVRVSEICLTRLNRILRIPDAETDFGKREFDILIIKMIKEFPEYKPSQLWKMLKADSIRENRIYDTEEILDEVDLDALTWSDRHGNAKTLKRKSFYNLIDRLKINSQQK